MITTTTMATSSQEPDSPKDISFDDIVTTLQCHPTANVIASGLIGGDIFLHSFSNSGECQQKQKISFHRKACRALKFSPDGRRLFSVSKDRTFCCVDSETGRLKRRIKAAHESPIYSLALSGEYFVATGDDDGIVKMWDIRSKKCVVEFKECADFISDMIVEDKKFIIASSGEGTLTSFNLRRRRMELQSELFDAELLCLTKMKRGEKLLCGSSDGALQVFNWGQWGNISDRITCGDDQINCIQAVTDNLLCIGTDNGFIRAVHVFPNRMLGVVGQNEENLPIEALSLSADTNYLASCSHDQLVKFWNIEDFKRQRVDTSKAGTKLAKRRLMKFGTAKATNFFSGLTTDSNGADDSDKDSDDDDDDDDDDSDEDDSD